MQHTPEEDGEADGGEDGGCPDDDDPGDGVDIRNAADDAPPVRGVRLLSGESSRKFVDDESSRIRCAGLELPPETITKKE